MKKRLTVFLLIIFLSSIVSAGGQPAPSAEEIRNAQRFGPSGSKVNTGPTGYVSQVRDEGSAAERQGCSNAAARYRQKRTQQLQEKKQQQQQFSDKTRPVDEPASPELPSDEDLTNAQLVAMIDKTATEQKELKDQHEQHKKDFKEAVDKQNKQQYADNLKKYSSK